jgi:hypothetical protein
MHLSFAVCDVFFGYSISLISSAAVPRTTEHTAEGKVILKNNLQLCVLKFVFLLLLGDMIQDKS